MLISFVFTELKWGGNSWGKSLGKSLEGSGFMGLVVAVISTIHSRLWEGSFDVYIYVSLYPGSPAKGRAWYNLAFGLMLMLIPFNYDRSYIVVSRLCTYL